jgi:uncharacterized protein (TIGR02246 family)
MKTFRLLLAIALLTTTPLFADATSDARAHSDAFARAFAARDAKAMLALYADDARCIWPGEGQEAIGRAQIGKLIDGLLKSFPTGTLTLKSQDAMALGPRYIAVVGQWEQTATTPDGHAVTFHIRTTEVLRKVGTQWLYVIDHVSIGLPPPPPPK